MTEQQRRCERVGKVAVQPQLDVLLLLRRRCSNRHRKHTRLVVGSYGHIIHGVLQNCDHLQHNVCLIDRVRISAHLQCKLHPVQCHRRRWRRRRWRRRRWRRKREVDRDVRRADVQRGEFRRGSRWWLWGVRRHARRRRHVRGCGRRPRGVWLHRGRGRHRWVHRGKDRLQSLDSTADHQVDCQKSKTAHQEQREQVSSTNQSRHGPPASPADLVQLLVSPNGHARHCRWERRGALCVAIQRDLWRGRRGRVRERRRSHHARSVHGSAHSHNRNRLLSRNRRVGGLQVPWHHRRGRVFRRKMLRDPRREHGIQTRLRGSASNHNPAAVAGAPACRGGVRAHRHGPAFS